MAEAARKQRDSVTSTGAGRSDAVRKVLDKAKAEGRTSLTAPEGKLVCDAYGIPVPKEGVANSAPEAAKLADGMGYPVVLKIVSPDILHKTEAGGVLVGLKSADEVSKGYDTILANAKKYKADAKIDGVQVQQMLKGGTEVIVGSITDGSFGKLVAFGLGGVLVEVLKDITFRLAPATRDDALSMLDGIQAAEMLKGVRGGEAVSRDALADVIVKVSQLVSDFPEIVELDLNPVFATPKDAIAADVRIVVDFEPKEQRHRPGQDEIVTGHEPHHAAEDRRRDRRLGRGRQDRQLGDEEPRQRRLQGPDLPDPPEGRGDPRLQGLQVGQGRARRDRRRGVRDPREVRRAGADRVRREEDPRRRADPVRLRRDRQPRGPGGTPEDRPEIQHPADGPEHLRLLLHARKSVRDLLHGLRRQGQGGAVVAIGRHRHGHHRLLALGQDGRLGHRRARQQVRPRRGRPPHLLRAGRQHAGHRPALRGPEGRPLLRRGGEARLQEEAGHHAEGGPHLGRRQGGLVAYGRARRQRQDLRGRPQAIRRHPRPLAARHAGICARHPGSADAEGRERGHHHGRRRLGRAACRTPASTTAST